MICTEPFARESDLHIASYFFVFTLLFIRPDCEFSPVKTQKIAADNLQCYSFELKCYQLETSYLFNNRTNYLTLFRDTKNYQLLHILQNNRILNIIKSLSAILVAAVAGD